tara:strand:- start:156 stop:404 length:249 start_codon:yes stop_codon:yes gene_type:complete
VLILLRLKKNTKLGRQINIIIRVKFSIFSNPIKLNILKFKNKNKKMNNHSVIKKLDIPNILNKIECIPIEYIGKGNNKKLSS